MTSVKLLVAGVLLGSMMAAGMASTKAASLAFTGSQFDLGGTFFPKYDYPQADIVPWRSDDEGNFYSISSDIDHRYYGTAGYALFATRFDFPNADVHPPVLNTVPANANIDPIAGDPNYPNIINLPNFITGSQILKSAAWRAAGDTPSSMIRENRLVLDCGHLTALTTHHLTAPMAPASCLT